MFYCHGFFIYYIIFFCYLTNFPCIFCFRKKPRKWQRRWRLSDQRECIEKFMPCSIQTKRMTAFYSFSGYLKVYLHFTTIVMSYSTLGTLDFALYAIVCLWRLHLLHLKMIMCNNVSNGLLYSRDAPPLLPSDTTHGYRTVKAKLGCKKVRPWKWMPFTNPARKDGAIFHHWRRAAEEGKDYPFARFNKVGNSSGVYKR